MHNYTHAYILQVLYMLSRPQFSSLSHSLPMILCNFYHQGLYVPAFCTSVALYLGPSDNKHSYCMCKMSGECKSTAQLQILGIKVQSFYIMAS